MGVSCVLGALRAKFLALSMVVRKANSEQINDPEVASTMQRVYFLSGRQKLQKDQQEAGALV